MKKHLLIIHHSPFALLEAFAAFDLTLGVTAFEQHLDLLFLEEGIWQIVQTVEPARVRQRSINKSLQALPLYGIESVYTTAETLQQRGLIDTDATLPLHCLPAASLSKFITDYDIVQRF